MASRNSPAGRPARRRPADRRPPSVVEVRQRRLPSQAVHARAAVSCRGPHPAPAGWHYRRGTISSPVSRRSSRPRGLRSLCRADDGDRRARAPGPDRALDPPPCPVLPRRPDPGHHGSSQHGRRPPLAGWAPFAVVLAVSAALLGFDLGGRVLATNDEARFPMMARDIVSNGHWLLPEISGVPMLNKPPLHAWLIALTAWPTGAVSQRTAVVPSFLGALGLVAVTYWIAQRVFGAGAGLAAGLIVATTAGVFAMARSPGTEPSNPSAPL